MRLSSKLYFSFALIALLAVIQGLIALKALKAEAGQARNVAGTYVPVLDHMGEINQQVTMAGYHMHAYYLSLNPEDYNKGIAVLDHLKDLRGKIEDLMKTYPEMLSKLPPLIAQFDKEYDNYREVCQKIHGSSGEIRKARADFAEEDKVFTGAINQLRTNFMSDQVIEKKNYAEAFSQATADQLVRRYNRLAWLDSIEATFRSKMSSLWHELATGTAAVAIAEAEKSMAAIVEETQKLLADTRQEKNLPPARALVASAEQFAKYLTPYKNANIAIENEGKERVAHFNTLLMLAKQIIEVGRNGAEAAATSADQAAQKGLRLQAICLLGVLVAGALTSFLIVRAVTGPLNRIATTLDKSARQVAEASGHVNSAAQSLAEGASAQVASLEETSSTLEQTASMVRQTSDNTAKGNESMQETGRLVAGGSEMVGRMSKAMSEITDSATQIGRIIKTIEEIAFQTNLLALNAAVEAARAGEAGKGFAVVADEVRNLAQRSAQAARDTSQLIENTVTRVRNGSEIVGQLTESYKTIEGSSGNVAQLIHEIKMATSEQAQGVDQVNHALTQIDQVTQQNAASAEECASASKELSAQAEAMRGMVDNLMAVISGERTTTTQGRSVPRLRSSRPVKSLARYVPTSETQKVMKSNDVISLDDDISDCKDF